MTGTRCESRSAKEGNILTRFTVLIHWLIHIYRTPTAVFRSGSWTRERFQSPTWRYISPAQDRDLQWLLHRLRTLCDSAHWPMEKLAGLISLWRNPRVCTSQIACSDRLLTLRAVPLLQWRMVHSALDSSHLNSPSQYFFLTESSDGPTTSMQMNCNRSIFYRNLRLR